MSATAVITTKTAENVIAVPLQAVIEKKPEGTPEATPLPGAPPARRQAKTDKRCLCARRKQGEIQTCRDRNHRRIGHSDHSRLSEGEEIITGPSRILNTLKEDTVVKKQTKKEGEDAKT